MFRKSSHPDDRQRKIIELIAHLARRFDLEHAPNAANFESHWTPLADGQMGSHVRKDHEYSPDVFAVGEAQFKDSDGTDVLITVFSNSSNEIVEIDLWKVDFSSLKNFPSHNEVHKYSAIS